MAAPRETESARLSWAGCLLFGLGLLAMGGVLVAGLALTLPGLSAHLDNYGYAARVRAVSAYRAWFPPPQYLPTPGAVAPAPTVTPTAPPTVTPTVTPTPTVAAVLVLEPLATVTPTATAFPMPTLAPLPGQVELDGITHQWQTWNNCGPATITMNTSYFGYSETQVEAARFLKPNRDDKNVSPAELAAYAESLGLETIVRQGGTLDTLKRFLAAGLPVLAETWLVHEGDGLGHYRLLTGYDDATEQFITYDSLNGPGATVGYRQFDADWRVFNRLYVVVYPPHPETAQTVVDILGPQLDEVTMYEAVLATAAAEVAANPADAIAHFNRGEALTRLGRTDEAVLAFDEARRLGLHWRRLWYQFAPFEAYYAAGRYQDVLDLADATLKNSGGLEEVYYYRGLVLQAMGQPGAADEFQAAVEYNPNFAPAAQALEGLSP